ncbi:hypothetical protein CSUI_005324, partial [Cystoisospora suis]
MKELHLIDDTSQIP